MTYYTTHQIRRPVLPPREPAQPMAPRMSAAEMARKENRAVRRNWGVINTSTHSRVRARTPEEKREAFKRAFDEVARLIADRGPMRILELAEAVGVSDTVMGKRLLEYLELGWVARDKVSGKGGAKYFWAYRLAEGAE